MKKKANFSGLFAVEKSAIGVIHLGGRTDQEIRERAKKEIQIYSEHEVDTILMENYYGDYVQLERALQCITSLNLPIPIGVNVLNVDPLNSHLVDKYHLQFLQIDSVVGHVKPRDETSPQAPSGLYRAKTTVKLIGGVRFKYQPMLSEKSVGEDLKIVQQRCDVIAVIENATDEETSLEEIELFRKQLLEFPLIIAVGLNDKSVKEQLAICDTTTVGSDFKGTRGDTGDIYAPYADSFVKTVKELRGE